MKTATNPFLDKLQLAGALLFGVLCAPLYLLLRVTGKLKIVSRDKDGKVVIR